MKLGTMAMYCIAGAAAALLGWDRAIDPGTCSDRLRYRRCYRADGMPIPRGMGWPAMPTRRGLDCDDGQGQARYIPRAALGRPPGPAERHVWARRRTLARRAERRAVERQGHRLGWVGGLPW